MYNRSANYDELTKGKVLGYMDRVSEEEGVVSIASILNKHGQGELYFGVKNDGTVIGQEIGEDTLRTVSQSIGNHIKPPIYPEISVKELSKARKAGRIIFEAEDKETVLKKLDLMDGKYLLNAGAALFCDTGINELQMAKFATDERITFNDIRKYTGSIIELADKAEKYVLDAMDWRAEIRGLIREEISEVPVAAIREAIINAFGHRIIEASQSVEIAIFKSRIEIYNYGAFPEQVSPEQFVEGNERPIRRNPLICKTLYFSKDMETFATGLKRISSYCAEVGCRFEFQKNPMVFALCFTDGGMQTWEAIPKFSASIEK